MFVWGRADPLIETARLAQTFQASNHGPNDATASYKWAVGVLQGPKLFEWGALEYYPKGPRTQTIGL